MAKHSGYYTANAYLGFEVINVVHSVATHSHIEFNTNNKREEIFLENIERNIMSNDHSTCDEALFFFTVKKKTKARLQLGQ